MIQMSRSGGPGAEGVVVIETARGGEGSTNQAAQPWVGRTDCVKERHAGVPLVAAITANFPSGRVRGGGRALARDLRQRPRNMGT
jgi:hypothetical protein